MNWSSSDAPPPPPPPPPLPPGPPPDPRAGPPPGPPPGPPGAPRPRPGLWRRCLWGGVVSWALAAGATYLTENSTLLPTLILLGSFLVPAVFVLWAYERHGEDLGPSLILGSFLTGGILGVLGASVLEYYLLHQTSVWLFLGVGLIEEAVKLGALMFVLRRHHSVRGRRAGLVLGATVGFGFAAFESAGYAFNAAVTLEGINLRALLETEVLRGVLSPSDTACGRRSPAGSCWSAGRRTAGSVSRRRSSAPSSGSPSCTPCGTRCGASPSGWSPGSPATGRWTRFRPGGSWRTRPTSSSTSSP